MQITPRYDGPPVVRIEGVGPEVADLGVAQRRRLGEALARFDESEWATPSRCEGWSNRDVVSHLATTNAFWAYSLGQGLAGEPTRFLVGFDPVASPADLVDADRHRSAAEVLEQYETSGAALAAVMEGADEAAWARPAEAPPGHLAATAVAAHALWDAWVHERDVLLPLGIAPPEVDVEVLTCLRYGVALGPGFQAASGRARTGSVAVHAHDPALRLCVTLGETVVVDEGDPPPGTPMLAGAAVELLEAFSLRTPFPAAAPPAALAALGGLDEVFDQA